MNDPLTDPLPLLTNPGSTDATIQFAAPVLDDPAPAATVPDYAFPDYTIPDYTAPLSTAPDTTAPNTAAPNTAAPGIAAPDNTPPPPATEAVICPKCGTAAMITLNRRESTDFCKHPMPTADAPGATCDFPLFWTPSAVVRDSFGASADEALRRLPGTVGRASLASFPCPHCAELNPIDGVLCIRCGRPLRPVEQPAPAPVPVYVPPPAPAPVYVPPEEPGTPWWAWLLLALFTVTVIVLIVLAANHQL